jgi:predicted nuclease of predicted toxin-antitoxin system
MTPPVKVLVDAQLPRHLARWLAHEAGFDALHTLDLPAANRTPDGSINEVSVRESRVVITKDADFVNTFILHGRPYKLLLVSTGNMSTSGLIELFRQHLPELTKALHWHSYLELSREQLVIHR